jgi:hypothetical protein
MTKNQLNTFKMSFGFAILLTLLAYQNCAEFSGASNNEFTSYIPEESIPQCADLSSRNFNPKLDFTWSSSVHFPAYNQVMSAPVVGDINGDGYPEIAFVSYAGSDYQSDKKGVLRVLNGATRAELLSIGSNDLAPSGAVSPLLIDIDRDGTGEIVYPHYKNKEIIALNSNGSLRWRIAAEFAYNCYGGLAAADLNGDGKAEIIKNGEIIYETVNSNGAFVPSIRKYKNNGNGCSHFAMTLTSSDAAMSIIDSTGVFDLRNGSYTPRFQVNNLDCQFSCFVAAADVDSTKPGKEIIYTGFGSFRIYSASGQIITNKNLTNHLPEDVCTYSTGNVVGGGSATIGDFDGNPDTTEFAIATGRSLTIFDKAGNKLAGSSTQDCSSLSTGVTSFDFNGDGKPEILYGDEANFKVYQLSENSQNLEVLWQTPNTSGTIWEYPVVVDLDKDLSPEILVVSNNLYSSTGNNGLRIYTADPTSDRWMPTRNVWNQHNYFISNVDLYLRATSSSSVSDELAKNFRRNLPGRDIRCQE